MLYAQDGRVLSLTKLDALKSYCIDKSGAVCVTKVTRFSLQPPLHTPSEQRDAKRRRSPPTLPVCHAI
jgi:hypothetical protein